MTYESQQYLIDDLDDLLERERQALVNGELEQLGRFLTRKEALITQINALETLERTVLTQIHEKVTRNQTLLNSAMEGIRAVADRMADLRRVRRGLETYDETGRKKRVETHVETSVEKRA